MLGALALLVVPAAEAAPRPDPGEAMAAKINAIRAGHGLPALRLAPKLMGTAQRYARGLMRNDTFSHGSTYRTAGFRTAGEMLAYTKSSVLKPMPAVRMWLKSPIHRGLMLSRSFHYIGAGPAHGRFGGALTTIWVVHLGAH